MRQGRPRVDAFRGAAHQAESDIKAGLNGKCANVVKEMVTNCAVSFDGSTKKQVLIMDEVDGMSGGDRGGVQDLIASIKARLVEAASRCCHVLTRARTHNATRRRPRSRSSASATTGGTPR